MNKTLQGKKSKVLFIAGAGRSGSTLLEMLLGQLHGFCSTGELRFIWSRSFGQNQLCGCGRPFRECEFWGQVVQEAFGGFQNVDHERLETLRQSAESHITKQQVRAKGDDVFAPYEEYVHAYRKLYQAIKKVSGCDYIIDSSKIVAPHGYILASIPEIELYTVHLIRDSRAVAYSWQRQKVRPEIHWEKRLMSKRGILRSTSRWNTCNTLAYKLEPLSREHTFLRYEDLVENPKDSIRDLLADLDIKKSSLDFLDGSHASLKPLHTVSGNPVRFKNREIHIKPDEQWRTAMAKSQKWMVTLLTWPLLMKYGYFKNGHRGGTGLKHDQTNPVRVVEKRS